jgi:hypothetical protein
MSKLNIAIIISTTRAARFGHKPAQCKHIAAQRDDIETEIVNLRDVPLPFFDEVATNAWAPTSTCGSLRPSCKWRPYVPAFTFKAPTSWPFGVKEKTLRGSRTWRPASKTYSISFNYEPFFRSSPRGHDDRCNGHNVGIGISLPGPQSQWSVGLGLWRLPWQGAGNCHAEVYNRRWKFEWGLLPYRLLPHLLVERKSPRGLNSDIATGEASYGWRN